MSEGVTRTSGRNSPTATIIRITPKQIAHGPLVGHFLNTVKGSDVVESVDRRAQSTVQTEDLVFDESSKGEVIEEVGKVFPNVGVAIFPQALVVETIDLSDLTGLVVATEDGNTLRVTNLQADQKGHSLDGIVASVDVITCSNMKVPVRMVVVFLAWMFS